MKTIPINCPACGAGLAIECDDETGELVKTKRAGHYECGSAFIFAEKLSERHGCLERQRDALRTRVNTLAVALQAMLDHEGETVVSGIGTESESEALALAREQAHTAISAT